MPGLSGLSNHSSERRRLPGGCGTVVTGFLAMMISWRFSKSPPGLYLEHDPGARHARQKWIPVFGKDHAPSITWSEMTIRREVISLQVVSRAAGGCAEPRRDCNPPAAREFTPTWRFPHRLVIARPRDTE